MDVPFPAFVPPARGAPAAPAAAASKEDALRAAREFEAVAIAELIRPMFEALDVDHLGGGGEGERMFRPMLVDEYAKTLAERGGVGLSDAVARALLAVQANANPGATA